MKKNTQFINDIIFNFNKEELKILDEKKLKEKKDLSSKIQSGTLNLIDNDIIICGDFIFCIWTYIWHY